MTSQVFQAYYLNAVVSHVLPGQAGLQNLNLRVGTGVAAQFEKVRFKRVSLILSAAPCPPLKTCIVNSKVLRGVWHRSMREILARHWCTAWQVLVAAVPLALVPMMIKGRRAHHELV